MKNDIIRQLQVKAMHNTEMTYMLLDEVINVITTNFTDNSIGYNETNDNFIISTESGPVFSVAPYIAGVIIEVKYLNTSVINMSVNINGRFEFVRNRPYLDSKDRQPILNCVKDLEGIDIAELINSNTESQNTSEDVVVEQVEG